APSPPRSPRRRCTRTSRSRPAHPRQAPPRTARTQRASPAPRLPLLLIEVEHGQERLLWHLDRADLLHPLLALLLLLEQLALAGDVAAVAFGEHVLPFRLHGLAGDHARTDRGLDRHIEALARDLLRQALDQRAAARIRPGAV